MGEEGGSGWAGFRWGGVGWPSKTTITKEEGNRLGIRYGMRTPSILFNWLRRITRTRSNNSSLKSHRSWRTVHPRNTRPTNNFALVSLVIANDQQNIATFSGPSIRIISYFFRNGNCFSPHHKPPMDNSNRAQYPSYPPLYSLSLSLLCGFLAASRTTW